MCTRRVFRRGNHDYETRVALIVPRPEVIIIGAGPAGVAAAIQLRRQGIKFVIFERDAVGGLLRNANLVENYPGFPTGIRGSELVTRLEEHLQTLQIEITHEGVQQVSFYEDEFIISTESNQYAARFLVVATGTIAHRFTDLPIPPEAATRVFHEAYPLVDFRGKQIIVVGGGDAAFDYALNLARANTVTIIHRGAQTRGLSLLKERAQNHRQIEIIPDAELTGIYQKGRQLQLSIRLAQGARRKELIADYLVFAIGRTPNLEIIKSLGETRQNELTLAGRLHFAGDVHNGLFRQATISVGDGIRAAMAVAAAIREGHQ